MSAELRFARVRSLSTSVVHVSLRTTEHHYMPVHERRGTGCRFHLSSINVYRLKTVHCLHAYRCVSISFDILVLMSYVSADYTTSITINGLSYLMAPSSFQRMPLTSHDCFPAMNPHFPAPTVHGVLTRSACFPRCLTPSILPVVTYHSDPLLFERAARGQYFDRRLLWDSVSLRTRELAHSVSL